VNEDRLLSSQIGYEEITNGVMSTQAKEDFMRRFGALAYINGPLNRTLDSVIVQMQRDPQISSKMKNAAIHDPKARQKEENIPKEMIIDANGDTFNLYRSVLERYAIVELRYGRLWSERTSETLSLLEPFIYSTTTAYILQQMIFGQACGRLQSAGIGPPDTDMLFSLTGKQLVELVMFCTKNEISPRNALSYLGYLPNEVEKILTNISALYSFEKTHDAKVQSTTVAELVITPNRILSWLDGESDFSVRDMNRNMIRGSYAIASVSNIIGDLHIDSIYTYYGPVCVVPL
jgi:hypothetical protein